MVIFTIFQMCVETMHACDFLRKRFLIDKMILLRSGVKLGFSFTQTEPDSGCQSIIVETHISFYFERFELFASSIFLFEIIASIIANINELNNLFQFLFIFDVLRIDLLRRQNL